MLVIIGGDRVERIRNDGNGKLKGRGGERNKCSVVEIWVSIRDSM